VNVNVSAPIKIFALVGLFAAVALGGGMMLLGNGQTEADAAPIVIPSKKKASPVRAPAAVEKKAAAPKSAKPKAAAKPAGAPVKPQPVAANGLPRQIALALRRHDVVVVSLWGTGGKIDGVARDEAAAGAAAAGAGFVALNVIGDARAAEALTLELDTVLRAPGVLLFTGSDTLANKLDGFRDRETVAQAALDALR
jgi:hypothetical protein